MYRAFVIQVAFRFGHSQVQHEFRPWINGKPSGRSGTSEAKLPDNEEHPNWILSNNNYFNPAKFVQIEKGKAWINEVEGLIHQKCAQADLRLENVLTNELFLKHNSDPPNVTLNRTGGMRQLLKSEVIGCQMLFPPPPLRGGVKKNCFFLLLNI